MIQEQTALPLLLNPSETVYQDEIVPRTTPEGMNKLAFRYAAYAVVTVLLAAWLKVLPGVLFSPPAKTTTEAPATPEPSVWLKALPQLFESPPGKADDTSTADSEPSAWLKLFPQLHFSPPPQIEDNSEAESDAAPNYSVWYNGLWGIFLFHLLLLHP